MRDNVQNSSGLAYASGAMTNDNFQLHSASGQSEAAEPGIQQILEHLRRAQEIAVQALSAGHHPFGCILVAPDNESVLLEQGNIDTVNHAEATLLRTAFSKFSPEYLWACTLYTSVEPCCMCAGTLYWANVGRLAYGISEVQLLSATGKHEQNPTLNIPCRYVFEHGQKTIKVWGPFVELEEEILKLHRHFWSS